MVRLYNIYCELIYFMYNSRIFYFYPIRLVVFKNTGVLYMAELLNKLLYDFSS